MATTKKTKTRAAPKAKTFRLITSDDKQPQIRVKQGMKLEVVSVSLMEPTLQKSKRVAARLCGGTSTCLALVEIDE